MEEALGVRLERLVSRPRLQRYRNVTASDFDAVVLYCWNVQLAESLIPSLAMLEVTLRNAVHVALSGHVGSEFWFKSVLHPRAYQNIEDLITRITRRQGTPPSADKVISEITLGFWPKVFARRYNPIWWDPENPLLASVLPHYPNLARDTRKHLEVRLEYFTSLRNRAMHQEVVFQGIAALNRPPLPVDGLHDQVMETLGWISPDAADIVRCMDRFGETHLDGKAAISDALRRQFDL